MKHYTKAELELFRHDQMSVLGRISCAAHLKSCEECARALRELEEEDRLVDDLRNSVRIYRELSTPATPRRTTSGRSAKPAETGGAN